MKHSDGSFVTRHGETIYTQNWTPAGTPRAVLLLVHGLAEHSSRYEGFAEFFTAAGFAVYTFDHPGHGRSTGTRCHIGKFEEFTSALNQYVEIIKGKVPNVPLVLVGHSMGGLIATSYLITRQSEFAAAVLSGPAIKAPQQPSRFAMFIARIIAAIAPRFGVMQLDSEGVSRDPEEVRKYDNDPLVFRGKVSARLAAEIFSAMDNVLSSAATIQIPILLLHGGSDSLTDVNGSRLLHDRVASNDKEIIIYDHLFHEIFNEPERLTVMTDLKNWLNARPSLNGV